MKIPPKLFLDLSQDIYERKWVQDYLNNG